MKPWHSPSECLWSTDTSISDQVSIAGIYPDLEDFFVTRLRVKKLTISMLVSDLKSKATAKAPLGTASAKLLIYKINAMLPNEALDSRLQGKFNELEGVKCFPVRGKDGHVMLTDAKADFAIVDNKRFGEAFTHEADLLDFSLDEVHVLRPLLEATRLTNHYLSGLVEEVSDIEGSPAQSSELTDRLHLVAYALFWSVSSTTLFADCLAPVAVLKGCRRFIPTLRARASQCHVMKIYVTFANMSNQLCCSFQK